MIAFQSTKAMPPILQRLNKALQSIQPTSVESERVFSAAGLFLTKLRTRMGDSTIDMLLFMKARLTAKEEHQSAARKANSKSTT